MTGCFSWLLLLALGIFVMLSLIRWFEQITEAVDQRWWSKVFILLAMPFTVWFFPSQVVAGRPSPVALHEPVRGFGSVPKANPPPQKPPRKGDDSDKIAKLRQKMREQGMMGEDDEGKIRNSNDE